MTKKPKPPRTPEQRARDRMARLWRRLTTVRGHITKKTTTNNREREPTMTTTEFHTMALRLAEGVPSGGFLLPTQVFTMARQFGATLRGAGAAEAQIAEWLVMMADNLARTSSGLTMAQSHAAIQALADGLGYDIDLQTDDTNPRAASWTVTRLSTA